MTKVELQDQLHDINLKLRSTPVRRFFEQQDDATFGRYLDLRSEVRVAFNSVANANLQAIADRLSENDKELTAGIESLQHDIERLNNAVAILNTVSAVLNIVARVVGLF